MTPEAFVEAFHTHRASAILRTDDPEALRPAMDAAIAGGFRVIEFTLTCPDVYEHLAAYARRDDVVLGAGTVLTVEQAERAVDAGARCLVSPVMDVEIIETAHRLGVAVMPGCHTATEMHAAHRAGAQLVKLFPAPGTGPTYVKSILAPMPFLKIVPTNGVHLNNAESYLKAGAYALGFTTALFDPNDMAAHRFERIEERAGKLLDSIGATIPAA